MRKANKQEGPEASSKPNPLRVRFTDVGIKALPGDPAGRRVIDYSDTVQEGLRLRVTPTGERIFMVAYRRPKDGMAIKLSIGSIRKGMKLADAREEAKRIFILIRQEPPIDPQEERRKRREKHAAETSAVRFAKACEAFKTEELPAMRPATRKNWTRYLDKEIIPAIGNERPEDITPERIAELRANISRGIPGPKGKDGKPTWIRKPAPVSAQRFHEVIHRVFAWLSTADPDIETARKRHGLVRLDRNPAASATSFRKRKRKGKKTRRESAAKAFSDDQIRAIFSAAAAVVAEARARAARMKNRKLTGPTSAETAARSFELLLSLVAFTAIRAHDGRASRREDVDERRNILTIHEHKISDHTGAPHLVPLSAPALAVLAEIRVANMAAGQGRSHWLFPADTETCEVCERPGHAGKDQKAADRIKRLSGVQNFGLHKLRDTIKTRMSEHGIDGRVSEAILSHVPPGIEGTYDHAELLPQRRAALEWWGEELSRILGRPLTAVAGA